MVGFQSTHPRGVRPPEPMASPCFTVKFQSTHPRGVRRSFLTLDSSKRPCFNPRTRVGCDQGDATSPAGIEAFQSTHPRGVRHQEQPYILNLLVVSIHAPAWGATRRLLLSPPLRYSFNPRTRVGCDRRTQTTVFWGTCFNPRTRVGCDRERGSEGRPHTLFQSTHPRGVRRGSRTARHRETPVSIHAPAWGATVSMFYPVDSRD